MTMREIEGWSPPKGNRLYGHVLTVSFNTQGMTRALPTAIKLAKTFEAELYMLVIHHDAALGPATANAADERSLARRRFEFLAASASQQAANAQVAFQADFVLGRPVECVLRHVREKRIDLLVLGDVRGSFIGDLVLGPLVIRLARAAPCAVHLL